jgi:hypothetical protein
MTKARIIAGLAALAAVAAGTYFALGRTGPTATATMGQLLADSGFTEFRPPSQHALPGTLVVMTSSQPVALGVICRPEQSLGLDSRTIPASPSISTDLAAALDRTLSLEASMLQKLKAGGKLSEVEDIRIRLTNVRLLELSDDVVLAGVADRSPACREALELRLASGGTVTMIKAALMADVAYVATTRSEAGGEVSADLRDTLASSLNSRVTSTGNGRIELAGEALILGIRDDQVLARIGTTSPATATETGGRSLLGAGVVVETLDVDDAAGLTLPGPRRIAGSTPPPPGGG